MDGANEVVITGQFSDTIDFGGGPLTAVMWDSFVAKLDATGNHLWSKNFVSNNDNTGISVATDGANDVILGGVFRGTLNLGRGGVHQPR